MSAIIVDAVVHKGHIRITEFLYKARAERAAKQWGDGTALKIRIEPEEEAHTYGQLKYFHGYVLEPLIEYTGDPDWKTDLKVMFLPEGKTSLGECNKEELQQFIERAEAYARQRCPEAYENCGREYLA